MFVKASFMTHRDHKLPYASKVLVRNHYLRPWCASNARGCPTSDTTMLSSSFVSSAIILAIFGAILLARRRKHSHKFNSFALPPGPPGWPIVGNLFDLPKERAWIVYSRWAKYYGEGYLFLTDVPPLLQLLRTGDVMFLRTCSTPIVVVSSADIAFELMDKRSAIYSSKPASVLDKMSVDTMLSYALWYHTHVDFVS